MWTGTEMIVVNDNVAAAYRPAHETVDPAARRSRADLRPPPRPPSGRKPCSSSVTRNPPTRHRSHPTIRHRMRQAPATSADLNAHQAGLSTTAPVNGGAYTLVTYNPAGRWAVLPAGGLTGDNAPDIVWDGHEILASDLWTVSHSPPELPRPQASRHARGRPMGRW